MRETVLAAIANELDIRQDNIETKESFWARCVYSAIGRLAYGFLFDSYYEAGVHKSSISIVHFKRKIQDLQRAYAEIFPEIHDILMKEIQLEDDTLSENMKNLFESVNGKPNETKSSLADYIYAVFLMNGCLYHDAYHITPAKYSSVSYNGITYLRGFPINEKLKMSGLGGYQLSRNLGANGINDVADFFRLNMKMTEDNWNHIRENLHFQETLTENQLDYLRMKEPYTKGYWVQKFKGEYAIGRLKNTFPSVYFLCKRIDNRLEVAQLPTHLYELFWLLNLFLKFQVKLPPTSYKIDGDLVDIQMGFLYPEAELRWFQLFSWPVSKDNSFSSPFHRIMKKDVFCNMMEVLKDRGFEFINRK